MQTEIPKIIHYCWFGKTEKPERIKNNIKHWKQILVGYDFVEWNESNFDVFSCEYVKQAYKLKKYAFVSDYVRLHALNTMGGIYLDTDVKILLPFDNFLKEDCFLSFESDTTLCTAVIGAKQDCQFIGKILNNYRKKHFILDDGSLDMTPNSELFFRILFNKKQERNKKVKFKDVSVYPVEYFCAKDYKTYELFVTPNTVAIHMLDASWYSLSKKVKRSIKKILIKMHLGFLWAQKVRK